MKKEDDKKKTKAPFEDQERHESFGMIGISRATCGPSGMNLFGSSIRHNSILILRVARAVKSRDLHREWIHADSRPIVQIILSPTQFADLITSLNVGDGVPCTLDYVNGKEMEDCPEVSQRQLFQQELEEDVSYVMTEADDIVREVKQTYKEHKGLRLALVKRIEGLAQHIRNNMPFLHTQFTRAMDRTTSEAKGEVEAFISNKIASLGINALQEDVVKALSAPAESPALQLPEHTMEGNEK